MLSYLASDFFFKFYQSKLGEWTRIKIESPSGFSEGGDSP